MSHLEPCPLPVTTRGWREESLEGGVVGVPLEELCTQCWPPGPPLLSPRLSFIGENSQEFSPTFSERIFIAGSKQYR